MANKTQKRNSMRDVADMRRHIVVKSNELIQKRTHMMSLQEQKIILFLISQLKPDQEKLDNMTFDIVDFCEMCGIDQTSGKNYSDLKKAILDLSNKGFWLVGEDEDTTARWIDRAIIKKQSGQIEIKLDNVLAPFLLQLKERYTQYELIYTLGMKSKYSVRLYEILKSYQKLNEIIHFELDRFRELVGADYEKWNDIRRFVIEPAIREINKLSDIFVRYTAQKKGRSVASVEFEIIQKRSVDDQIATRQAISKVLDHSEPMIQIKGQLMLDGSEVE